MTGDVITLLAPFQVSGGASSDDRATVILAVTGRATVTRGRERVALSVASVV